MGLKYVEPIKSIILLLLVLLSITFTFSIWTYTPRLPNIEQSSTVDISIGQQKEPKDLIKPYKVLINYGSDLKGTTVQREIDNVLKEMGTWKVPQLVYDPKEMNKAQMKEFLQQPNQFTLYFHGEVPLQIYDEILSIDEENLPNASFDRLVVKWNPKEIAFEAHFINRATGGHYYGKVLPRETMTSYRNIVIEGEKFAAYAELKVEEPTYIAVPVEPTKMVRSKYYQEEISPTRFRDALFNDPNAVRRSQVDANHEEFGDDHAFMIVNTELKMLNFVHPTAESSEPIAAADLLKEVIDSINEHGGWTNSFRFSDINPYSRHVKFQLFNHGYPVYSDIQGTTEISETYGENRVFRYNRPYYSFVVSLGEDVDLPPGIDIAEALMESEKVDFATVEDITIGYMMKHDLEERVFVMEPAWFYLIKDKWLRYVPEQSGGEQIGLE